MLDIAKLRRVELFKTTPHKSYGMSLAIYDHSVTCHSTQGNTPHLNPSQRTVLDLPTQEGWYWKAKQT